MTRLYCMTGGDEMVRRRALIPRGSVVEAWADVDGGGTFWVGEESKRLLDAAGERPMTPKLSVPAEAVATFYGPQLTDIESLPREESVRARVLSMHGIAVAWITLDRFGRRVSHEPTGAADPIFHLRRPGGGAGHVWRRFESKADAVVFMRDVYGVESEAAEWAEALEVDDFDGLLRRHARKHA